MKAQIQMLIVPRCKCQVQTARLLSALSHHQVPLISVGQYLNGCALNSVTGLTHKLTFLQKPSSTHLRARLSL